MQVEKEQCSWTSTSQGKLLIDHKTVFLPNGVLGMEVENNNNSYNISRKRKIGFIYKEESEDIVLYIST